MFQHWAALHLYAWAMRPENDIVKFNAQKKNWWKTIDSLQNLLQGKERYFGRYFGVKY